VQLRCLGLLPEQEDTVFQLLHMVSFVFPQN
jgi:hypothetical protein